MLIIRTASYTLLLLRPPPVDSSDCTRVLVSQLKGNLSAASVANFNIASSLGCSCWEKRKKKEKHVRRPGSNSLCLAKWLGVDSTSLIREL